MALGVIDSCKKNGISGVPVLGIDATADGCAAIQAGDMAFTVYQSGSGQGEAAVKAAIALGSGGTTQGMEGLSDDGLYVWVPVSYTHLLWFLAAESGRKIPEHFTEQLHEFMQIYRGVYGSWKQPDERLQEMCIRDRDLSVRRR